MPKTIFHYSKENLKKRNKRNKILMTFACLIGLGFWLVSIKEQHIEPSIIILGLIATIIMTIVIFYFITKMFNKIYSNTEIFIDDADLGIKSKSINTVIPLADIHSIRIDSLANSGILKITVKSKKRTLIIEGLQKMDNFFTLLKEKISNPSIITINELKKNPHLLSNQILQILLGIALYGTVIFLTVFIPDIFNIKNPLIFSELIEASIPLAIGLFFLLFKPFTKKVGEAFRKKEIILSSVLIASALALIILSFLDYTPNAGKYVGSSKDGKKHGQGIYTWTDGAKYVGSFKNGKRHGKGIYTYKNGSSSGSWENGQLHGQATKVWYNRGKYVGSFKNGKKDGQGTFLWQNGDKYVGSFKDDKLHGQGTMTSQNNYKYVGNWENNKKHGQGTMTIQNGDKYVGSFKDDKLYGQGTMTWHNGDRHVGSFQDDKRHGYGTFTWPNGKKNVGYWENNKFIRKQK